MSRPYQKVFSKTYNTKQRRELMLDYDYINQLNEEEKQWLATFTDEYYCASYQIAPAWSKRDQLLNLLKNELIELLQRYKCVQCKHNFDKMGNCPQCDSGDVEYAKQRLVDKLEHNIDRVNNTKGDYIQIYGNENTKNNIDLRKCRKIDVFFKDGKGKYTSNVKYKYIDNIHNVDDPKIRKDCNARSNASAIDLMNNKIPVEQNDDKLFTLSGQKMLQGEEYFELIEDIKYRLQWDDEITIEVREELESLLSEYKSKVD